METALIIALIQVAAQLGAPFVANLITLVQNNQNGISSITPEQIAALKGNVKVGEDYFK